jgi:hypothetical protein
MSPPDCLVNPNTWLRPSPVPLPTSLVAASEEPVPLATGQRVLVVEDNIEVGRFATQILDAPDVDVAPGLLGEPEYLAEAEPRPLADLLGREERLEDATEHVPGTPWPGKAP